jgi:hypothetical protein
MLQYVNTLDKTRMYWLSHDGQHNPAGWRKPIDNRCVRDGGPAHGSRKRRALDALWESMYEILLSTPAEKNLQGACSTSVSRVLLRGSICDSFIYSSKGRTWCASVEHFLWREEQDHRRQFNMRASNQFYRRYGACATNYDTVPSEVGICTVSTNCLR